MSTEFDLQLAQEAYKSFLKVSMMVVGCGGDIAIVGSDPHKITASGKLKKTCPRINGMIEIENGVCRFFECMYHDPVDTHK